MDQILIADDNPQLLDILKMSAQKEGYEVLLAEDGQMALDMFLAHHPQMILLDVMMPKSDGFQVCREIRRTSDVPIIMITARGEDFEKIMGLEIGADDYIVKPFSPGEVMARVKAVMRRVSKSAEKSEQILSVEDLCINLIDYSVSINSERISLTKKETDMLWGYDYYGDPRTVDSHIKRLRAKLDAVSHPTWEIRTIRNVGYKFEVLS